MELPVSKASYRATPDSLARAVKRANLVLARTAAQENALEGTTALTNPDRPAVRVVNHAAEVNVPAGMEAEAVLGEIDEHFIKTGVPCHKLIPADVRMPAPLIEPAVRRGFRPVKRVVWLLESWRPPARVLDALQIIPARAAYAEVRRLDEGQAREWTADDRVAADLTATFMDFLDEPRLESFLGRIDRQPVGLVEVLTLGNIGVITCVYTDPDHRRRGVAATLLHHALEHCQRALFENVVLETAEGFEAGRLYESAGFRPVATHEFYTRADGP